MQGAPDALIQMWQLWEALAIDFLVTRLETRYTFAKMEKRPRETRKNKAFAGGPDFLSRISVRATTVQVFRMNTSTAAYFPQPSTSRSFSVASFPLFSALSCDEYPPGAKRKTDRQSGGPSQKKVKLEKFEAKLPQWEELVTYERAFTITNCQNLYVPWSRMNPLFGAVGMAIGADGVRRGYLFKMYDRNGEPEGEHGMNPIGLDHALSMFPLNTQITFVFVVPDGKKAKLMIPYGHREFEKWSYYTLEILGPSWS
ncbi:hypothetical protein GGX14DRAFT_440287 [Mycena pura]|uniref:Uncharacterized protein n=1 Tax=Mycena pura TaxID=153505 RepID=A0AAD6VM07_9AGAR|nr:hypothetical protein GGX14DRAFT_440287 [Mycena pura]